MSGFEVYFDITTQRSSAWAPALIPVGVSLVFLVACLLPGAGKLQKVFGAAGVALGLIACGLILYVAQDDYHRWPKLLAQHRYEQVEGIVENMNVTSGGGSTSFTVQGKRFENFQRSIGDVSYNIAKDPRRFDIAGKCARIKFVDRTEIIWFGVKPPPC